MPDPDSQVGHVERAVVSQIADIQRRRLPEPPPFPHRGGGGGGLDPYDSLTVGQDGSVRPQQLSKRLSEMSEHAYMDPTEGADYGEYLRPTFVSRHNSRVDSRPDSGERDPIPAASYQQNDLPNVQQEHLYYNNEERAHNLSGAPLISESAIEV